MRYQSTRDPAHTAPLTEAISRGLAPDGGLYVPERFPRLEAEHFAGVEEVPGIAARLLSPFFEGSALEGDLPSICRSAFNFPIPLRPLRDGTAVLELFHGPTAAFKDVGARFLAECLSRLHRDDSQPLLLLVATSGDTGGAVAAACHGLPGIEVVVLFPQGMVSPRQEKQLTSWGGNVRAFAVRGDFDACQRVVKAALVDPELRARRTLSSANSINLGRLLPQMVYYAAASLWHWRSHGRAPGFVIPSGNVGNAAACLWARQVGLPIREVVLATNANPALTDFVGGAEWTPAPTVSTLATAMDVGNPSNMERVFHLFGGHQAARAGLRAFRVEDEQIREQIRSGPQRWGEVWDPHTATAVAARERLDGTDWIVVSTAHPAKFEGVVEPLVGREVPIPPALAAILDRPSHAETLEPSLEALRGVMGNREQGTGNRGDGREEGRGKREE
jgi:threonine synthase